MYYIQVQFYDKLNTKENYFEIHNHLFSSWERINHKQYIQFTSTKYPQQRVYISLYTMEQYDLLHSLYIIIIYTYMNNTHIFVNAYTLLHIITPFQFIRNLNCLLFAHIEECASEHDYRKAPLVFAFATILQTIKLPFSAAFANIFLLFLRNRLSLSRYIYSELLRFVLYICTLQQVQLCACA